MEEEDQLRFGFDLLDPTKIVPEEYVPITPLGKMQLNRNPRNYFAETEQAMVCNSSYLFDLLCRASKQSVPKLTSTVPTWSYCPWY